MAFAEEDLRMAELALGASLPNQVCFHAHQSAEKVLKALVAHRNIVPPRTHRLLDLLELLDEPALEEIASEAGFLEGYYILTRYPDALPGSSSEGLPGEQEAREALAVARRTSEAVQRIIAAD